MLWRLCASAGCLFSVVLITASCLVTHTLHGSQAGRLASSRGAIPAWELGGSAVGLCHLTAVQWWSSRATTLVQTLCIPMSSRRKLVLMIDVGMQILAGRCV